MEKRLNKVPKALTLIFGAATLTSISLPGAAHAQSTATQDRQQSMATQDRQAAPGDDVTRRDVARFDQFLDTHHEIADQLRKTPSLIDDPQFLQSHPELNSYLQDHPSVKQEISRQPDTFMRLEDYYDHDRGARDRDAGGAAGVADRDAGRGNAMNQDRDADRRDATTQDRDADRRGPDDRNSSDFNRFLDGHREIGEQVRKNPSLCDDRNFVSSHPALRDYLQANPGVRDQLRQDPNFFMRQSDLGNRDMNPGERNAIGQDRDAYRGNAVNNQGRDNDRRDMDNFGRFLDQHREVGEQVRKNPSLVDDRNFVNNHPDLQAYLRDNPGVRDQLRQNPGAFTQQANFNDRDRDPMHDHMADFGGFLHSHSDIDRDMTRDPSRVKDEKYVHDHAELNAYLNAHPDVRAEMMANPENFVRGAQQFNNGNTTGNPGAGGVKTDAGTSTGTSGTTGVKTGVPGTTTPGTGMETNPAAPTHTTKPN